MTLIDSEATIESQCSSSSSNLDGSNKALETLEGVTKNWVNVNTFNYSIGDASITLGFSTLNVTDGYIDFNLEEVGYTLNKTNVKAR